MSTNKTIRKKPRGCDPASQGRCSRKHDNITMNTVQNINLQTLEAIQ